MFKATIDGKELKVWFMHAPKERQTMCFASNDVGVVLLTGASRVNPIDQYDKERGRRVALKKMLEKRTRDERKAIFALYEEAQQDARGRNAGKQAIEVK